MKTWGRQLLFNRSEGTGQLLSQRRCSVRPMCHTTSQLCRHVRRERRHVIVDDDVVVQFGSRRRRRRPVLTALSQSPPQRVTVTAPQTLFPSVSQRRDTLAGDAATESSRVTSSRTELDDDDVVVDEDVTSILGARRKQLK